MDRTSAGKKLKEKSYRRGEMLQRDFLMKQAPGKVIFVVCSSLVEKTFVANGPMVLNSVDEKLATFLSEEEHVQFWMKGDEEGRSHVYACWSIFKGKDVRLYEALEC